MMIINLKFEFKSNLEIAKFDFQKITLIDL
jgi:hypothetical protein